MKKGNVQAIRCAHKPFTSPFFVVFINIRSFTLFVMSHYRSMYCPAYEHLINRASPSKNFDFSGIFMCFLYQCALGPQGKGNIAASDCQQKQRFAHYAKSACLLAAGNDVNVPFFLQLIFFYGRCRKSYFSVFAYDRPRFNFERWNSALSLNAEFAQAQTSLIICCFSLRYETANSTIFKI